MWIRPGSPQGHLAVSDCLRQLSVGPELLWWCPLLCPMPKAFGSCKQVCLPKGRLCYRTAGLRSSNCFSYDMRQYDLNNQSLTIALNRFDLAFSNISSLACCRTWLQTNVLWCFATRNAAAPTRKCDVCQNYVSGPQIPVPSPHRRLTWTLAPATSHSARALAVNSFETRNRHGIWDLLGSSFIFGPCLMEPENEIFEAHWQKPVTSETW